MKTLLLAGLTLFSAVAVAAPNNCESSLSCRLDNGGVSYIINADTSVGVFKESDIDVVCTLAGRVGVDGVLVTFFNGDVKTVTACKL